MRFTAPEPLARQHILDGFDSGEPALDDWIARHARSAHASGSARVYVTTTDGAAIVGYYALAAAQVEPTAATPRLLRGEPRHRPVPVVLLARLAVDRRHQNAGVGRSLLRDALLRCLQAADAIGIRGVLVHAKHEAARTWYEQLGCEPSPTDPLHLVVLLKDVRASIERR